eukprot:Nk52_evm10s310 gene=Nk52_evmTU10s310
MAFVDNPDELIQELRRQWVSLDDSGVSEKVLCQFRDHNKFENGGCLKKEDCRGVSATVGKDSASSAGKDDNDKSEITLQHSPRGKYFAISMEDLERECVPVPLPLPAGVLQAAANSPGSMVHPAQRMAAIAAMHSSGAPPPPPAPHPALQRNGAAAVAAAGGMRPGVLGNPAPPLPATNRDFSKVPPGGILIKKIAAEVGAGGENSEGGPSIPTTSDGGSTVDSSGTQDGGRGGEQRVNNNTNNNARVPGANRVNYADTPVESRKKEEDDMFQEVAVKVVPKQSMLTSLLKTKQNSVNNPFNEYSKFCGDGLMMKTVSIEFFFAFGENEPPCSSMKLSVQGLASVEQATGYALFKYVEEDRKPKPLDSIEFYNLRIVEEDDGTPDMDLPALDRKQPIQKFFFDQLAICELPNAREKASAIAAKPANVGESVKMRTTFVKIYLPQKGLSILNITSADILLKEVLDMVTRKRHLAAGQHTLELVDAPGVELDLNQTLQSLNRLEFNLIHKYSKRVDLNEEEMDQSGDYIQMSWKLNQYKQYVVTKLHKFRMEEVMLGFDVEKMTLVPFGNTTSLWGSKQKLVTYGMENVVHCTRLPEKSHLALRFVLYTGSSYKNYDFETKSVIDLDDIMSKMGLIINSYSTEQKDNFLKSLAKKTKKKAP